MVRLLISMLVGLLLSAAEVAAQPQAGPVTVRDATTGAVVPNIGDTANKALRVYCVGGTCTGGGGGGGTSGADRSAFVFGTTNLTPIGGVFDDTPPGVLTTGLVGAARVTAYRALHVNLRDASGNVVAWPSALGQTTMANSWPVTIASNQTALPVTGTFWQVTQPVSGTFWQVTQPVSIASMPSTPVTGTFWQVTQPVSATDLDVRDLVFATDKVDATGSGVNARDGSGNALASSAANIAGTERGLVTRPVPIYRTATLQNAATANGNGTAIDVSGLASVMFTTSGTFAGGTTLNFEMTQDGSNWASMYAAPIATPSIQFTTQTSNTATVWTAAVAGATAFRVRISNYNSGNVTVTATASSGAAATSVPIVAAGGATLSIFGAVTASDPTYTDATGTGVPANVAVVGGSDSGTTRALGVDPNGKLSAYVTGLVADGVAATGNPVRVAGKDNLGNTQDVITDTTGNLQVGIVAGAAVIGHVITDAGSTTIANAYGVNNPQGLAPTTYNPGSAEPVQVSNGAVWVRAVEPVQVWLSNSNPLLQPCNAVRRTTCRK